MSSPTEHPLRTMKAITQHRYGGLDLLDYATVARPVAAKDEVLIRVQGASINAADWLLMKGEPFVARLAFGLRRPKVSTRGRDVAGVIEAVGDNVRRFSVGDEVYAEVDAGSFAEYTVAPAKRLAHKPSQTSFGEAAAVPIAATTALQGMRDVAKIKPGDKVLINGASGGVGSFAVQLGKAFGAEVTGVCSTANLEFVRSLGADLVIDYTGENFASGEVRYDVIFDLVGNRSLAECRRALTRRGTLVLASGNGGRVLGPIRRMLAAMLLSMFVTQNLRPLSAVASGRDLEVLRELIEAGTITPPVDRSYPLAETPEAIRYFVEEHARGKITITVTVQNDTKEQHQ
jgi:NADPH:quinone reductase-like Zn-dependent oxidoreductase